MRLNRPLWPLLLVILSPLVTLPITWGIISFLPDCGVDEPAWQLRHMQLALLPGLVDLFSFVWVVSAKAQVRRAAAVAGLIGFSRLALPQVLVGIYATSVGGPVGDISCPVSVFLLQWLIPLVLGVWAASALLCVLVHRRVTRAFAG